jgi:hypothetical protein
MTTLTKSELRIAVNTLRVFLCSGKDDEEARVEMGLSVADFASLKRRLFSEEVAKLQRMSVEEWFVDYIVKQSANVKALSDMLVDWKDSKQQSAMVGAVRARSEIYDKIIERGQSFGLIARQPEEKRIIAGIAVANLTNDQLQRRILGTISELNRYMSTNPEVGLLELEPGELYSGPGEVVDAELPADPPPKASKKVRSKTSRVHKGRRRVKAAGE